jgi:hypothetical protein
MCDGSLDSGNGGDERGCVVLGLSTRKSHGRALQPTLFSIGTSSLVVFTLLILFYFRWETQVTLRTSEPQKTLAELWSEMDLARKIQTVLLPSAQVFASATSSPER